MLSEQVLSATLNNVQVTLTKASDIPPSSISWVWDGWLAQGKFHVLAGVPEAGKTQIALDVASRISRGDTMPDGSEGLAGSAIIWSGEDDPNDTLVPRLIRSGAALDRVRIITGTNKGPFDPSRDMGSLLLDSDLLDDLRLLILDPVISAVTGDSNQANQVRRALQPIVDFAAKTKCAVLGISHLTKGTSGRDPLERITGSGAFGAVPRVVWFASKGAEQRILCRVKSNISESGGGLHYSVVPKAIRSGVLVSGVEWGQRLVGSAVELIGGNEFSDPDLAAAKELLIERLSLGAVSSKDIDQEAKDLGIGRSTLNRAKKALKVTSKKSGFKGGWVLCLHEEAEEFEESNTASSVSSQSSEDRHDI
jgi:putative DNA primase/helicase